MKIITLHCDYIKFQAIKKAVKDAEELTSKSEVLVKEPLVVLTAVEQGDNKETLKELVSAVENTAKEVKAKNIVLYPYAHLSSNLASPALAFSTLKQAELLLKKTKKLKVVRAPFGYYKSFELKCKGHPLAELAKQFYPSGNIKEEVDIKELVKKMEKEKFLQKHRLKEGDNVIVNFKEKDFEGTIIPSPQQNVLTVKLFLALFIIELFVRLILSSIMRLQLEILFNSVTL